MVAQDVGLQVTLPRRKPAGAPHRRARATRAARALTLVSRTVALARSAPSASTPTRLLAEVARLRAELAAAQARLADVEAKADRDPLLDVFNRRGFMRELERALAYMRRYGNPAALVYLDLDRFKPVNDRYGHAAGDAVLHAVAQTLTRNVRASDIVARLGGDEFAVLLWNLDEAAAHAKATALEAKIAGTEASWSGHALIVGASAGVAVLDPAETAATLLARADAAMYTCKRARR